MAQAVPPPPAFFSWYNLSHLTQHNADPDRINFFSWGTVTNLTPPYRKSPTQVGYEFLTTKDFPKIADLWGQVFLRVAAVYKDFFDKISFIDLSVVKEVSIFGKRWKLAMGSYEGWKKFNAFNAAGASWVRACRLPATSAGQVLYYNEKGERVQPELNKNGHSVRPAGGIEKRDLVFLCFLQIMRHGSDFANSVVDFAGFTAYFVVVKHLIYMNAIGSVCTFSGSVSNFWDDWLKLSNIDRERIEHTNALRILRSDDPSLTQARAALERRLHGNSDVAITPETQQGWINDLVRDIQRCNQKIAYQLLCLWMDIAYIGVGSLGCFAYAGHLGLLGNYAFLTAVFCPWILQCLIAAWIASVALFVFKNYVDPKQENQDSTALARTVRGMEERDEVTRYLLNRHTFIQAQGRIDHLNGQVRQLTQQVYDLQQQLNPGS